MNYRHFYHAGNFADVVKHVVLIALLKSLQRKDKPYCYIDTHAGIGFYDLFSDFTLKTKEYQNGIEKIIQQEKPPALVKDYLDCVHTINNKLTVTGFSSLRYYPGSPLIARHFLRPHDKIIACELHPEDYQSLRNAFAGDRQVAIHHSDGYLSLKAFLPPPERRGLILIDPPYENPEEFNHIVKYLGTALQRFETGIYAIWYPIKERIQLDRFYRNIKDTIEQPVLAIELTIYPDLPHHLNGCGMVIINPPYQFEETIKDLMAWLWKALTINGQGTYRTFSLK